MFSAKRASNDQISGIPIRTEKFTLGRPPDPKYYRAESKRHFCKLPFCGYYIFVFRRKLYEILTITFSVASLLVASVSACACSHHQAEHVPPVETGSSCHSTSHYALAAAEDSEPSQPKAGSDCNCFVRVPIRAVTAKLESKNFSLADVNKANAAATTDPEHYPVFTAPSAAIPYGQTAFGLGGNYRTRPPSRAPPRL